MSSNWPKQGANFVPAYQLSGTPFVTSSSGASVAASPQKITFPYVTRFVEIRNTGGGPTATGNDGLRVGFSSNGVDGKGGSVPGSLHERNGDHTNYFVLPASGSTGRLEIRCKEIYVRRDGDTNTDFTLLAGLTTVHTNQFPTLTGSNGFIGIG